jgi:serine-type D-Ala-D-Ala carboxypeptidase
MRAMILAMALLSVAAVTPGPDSTDSAAGRFDRPQVGFAPAGTRLRDGTPEEVGLDRGPIDTALRRIARWTQKTPELAHPMYAGAVSLLVHDGVVVRRDAVGKAVRYADAQGTELPADEQEPMRTDTLFDLASVTKLFTSIAALQQVEVGKVRLDSPVARYLPEFAVHGKQAITVQQLLTHTSGLQAEVHLWTLPPEQRIPSVLALTPEHPPGTTYTYSDANMITLGVLVERVTGKPLDRVVTDGITAPLGLRDTGYRPAAAKLRRIAATEFESDPPRGMVRGQVHDENAWSLGGVAGQAGIFSTADDLARLGQALLNGGTYAGRRILSQEMVDKMLTDYNTAFPGNAHGLGFELDQRWYMAGLSAPRSAGHTGFTGTSLVLDPASRSIVVLLTNRVHPSRDWGSNNASREALAEGLAQALAVRPSQGDRSWFAGGPRQATLTTADLGTMTGPARVSFDAFLDTQNDPDGIDPLFVESSVDGSTWQPVTVTATGPGAPQGPQQRLAGAGHRAWWHVRGLVPTKPGQQLRLRWRYAPDARYVGRGVNLDGIAVNDGDRTVLDGQQQESRFVSDGWVRTSR